MAKRAEIRALTGFRGVAALIVALYHFSRGFGGEPVFSVGPGYAAVDAFFVLSGYVLAYNYASTFSRRFDKAEYWDFLIKRICRVYPAYIAILLVATAKLSLNFGGAEHASLDGWDAFCNIFMLTGWGLHATPIMGVSWSVSAELFCYLLFPLMALLTARQTFFLGFVVVAALAAIAGMSQLGLGIEGPMDIVSSDHSFALARALCGFALGVVGYALAEKAKFGLMTVVNYSLPVALAALAASWYLDDTDLVNYVLIVLVVWLIAQGSKVSETVFGNRPVYFLGEISYSLYLIHPLLVPAFAKLAKRLLPTLGVEAGFAVALCAYLVLAIGLSYGTYLAFELWGKRVMLRALLPKRRAAA